MSEKEEPRRRKMADGAALREEKRRKYQAKQNRKNLVASTQRDRETWFREHSRFATLVTEQDVGKVKVSQHVSAQSVSNDATDKSRAMAAHLEPYFDIQDNNEQGKGIGRFFIAEGTETVRVLLQQSIKKRDFHLDRIKVKSIFVKPSVLFDPPVNLMSDVERALSNEDSDAKTSNAEEKSATTDFNVLVGESENVLSKVAGFPISRGALACGIIPQDRNETWLDDYLHNRLQPSDNGEVMTCRLLALDGICDTANLGSMIRTASALGVNVIVLSHDTCDAWYRRSIRVSMGHIFLIPIVRVKSLAEFLAKWNTITSFAAVVQQEDSIALHTIPPKTIPSTWCCVFGNEGNGISKVVMARCSKIRIEMIDGVDSLSVPIACGILLHGLREREQQAC
jgi:tRNA G18 (ribose-2'-O)-methylase SpoU